MKVLFDHVSFAYQEEDMVLKNLSFQATTGQHLGIEGPSGSGKTTIFRLLMGFDIPDRGEISVDGQTISASAALEIRKNIAWLPQDLDMGKGQTSDLFYFPFDFKANRSNKPEESAILDTFDELGLSHKLWRTKFHHLSTGQRQRVGIAMLYFLNKPVVLLDEPTSSLDMKSREKVLSLLKSRPGQILISTSHDMWWLKQCDSVISLNKHA